MYPERTNPIPWKKVPLHLEDSLMISQGQPFRTHFPRSAHAQRCNQGVKVDPTKTSFFRQELGSVPYLNSKEIITDLPTNWPTNEWLWERYTSNKPWENLKHSTFENTLNIYFNTLSITLFPSSQYAMELDEKSFFYIKVGGWWFPSINCPATGTNLNGR